MIQIEANWTALFVLLVMMAAVAMREWMSRREAARVRCEHDRAVSELVTDIANTKGEFIDRHNTDMQNVLKQYQTVINNQGLYAATAIHTRDVFICRALPYLLRNASLCMGSDKGNDCAALVYIANCLGLLKADKENARLIAHVQVIAAANPTELDKLITKMALELAQWQDAKAQAEQPDPYAAPTKVKVDAPTDNGVPLVIMGNGDTRTEVTADQIK